MSIRNFSKDASDILDYTFQFGPTPAGVVPSDPGWLLPGDTITGIPTITVTGSDAVLVVSTGPTVINGVTVLFWLSGGTYGVTYTVNCLALTTQGRAVRKSITVDIVPM